MPVERIIFGTMTLGYHGRGVRVRDVSTARRMLDHFHSRGYREIDTCYVYGDGSCEQMLGDLRVHDHLKIALRYDPVATARGHEPEVLRASLSASLKRLRVARADLLYLNLHGRDTRWEDTLRTVHELHEEGLVTEYWNEPYLQGMRQLRAACEALGVSPTDAALRWLVHHSHLGAAHGDGIILGASRPEHLVQNLDAVQSSPLPPELLVAIDAASETTRPAWPSTRRA